MSWLSITLVGMTVTATATLDVIDGRRLVFTVSVLDEVERIGEGTHERFIVNQDRFESKVREKMSH